MRPRLVTIALLIFIQLVSFASAQNAPDISKKKNFIYAEIGKAPDKARARQNPLGTTPKRSPPGGFCTRNTAPSATAEKPKAEREDQVFSSRKSKAPNQASFSGF
jgi:hypothetical protein